MSKAAAIKSLHSTTGPPSEHYVLFEGCSIIPGDHMPERSYHDLCTPRCTSAEPAGACGSMTHLHCLSVKPLGCSSKRCCMRALAVSALLVLPLLLAGSDLCKVCSKDLCDTAAGLC